MSEANTDQGAAAVEEAEKFAEEVEAHGDSIMGGKALEDTRALLHQWVDTVTGVVTVPAFGRVSLIHSNGKSSTITSPELPFAILKNTAPKKRD